MVDGSGQAGGFQWGYALGGLCFAVLAAFRLDDGSTLWAAVFGLAALANAYLWVRFVLPSSLGGVSPQEAGQPGPASPSSEPSSEEMRRALQVYESRTRGWLVISAAGWVTTAGMILLTPPLALLTAALSLFSAYRFRRCRRSVRILRRTLALDTAEATGGKGHTR
ncbi:MAG: hypothetical protein M3341_09960 [Actinomycetota bacterium]|nr:hypothetical protein [Actinomycetota bacterium]